MTRPKLLVGDEHVAVLRLHGRPREPLSGRHRLVLVYVAPAVSLVDVAVCLRACASALEAVDE